MASKIDSLQEQLETCRKNNDSLHNQLQDLRNTLEQERQGNKTVSQAVHNAVLEALVREQQKVKHLQNLLDRIKNQDNEALLQEIGELKTQLQQAKQKLSRPNSGKERQSSTTDAEIVELRKAGKTVKAIAEQTGVSTTTINRVLKENNIRVLKVYNNDNDTKEGEK